MNIAIATNTRAHPGGITTDTNSLADAFRMIGHQACVISFSGSSKYRKDHPRFTQTTDSALRNNAALTFIAYHTANILLLLHTLIEHFKSPLDIIYAMDFSAANAIYIWPPFRKKLFLRIYVEYTKDMVLQGKLKENTSFHKFFVRQENKSYFRANLITPNSEWSRKMLHPRVPHNKISAPSYSPIDIEHFSKNKQHETSYRQRLGFSSDDFIFLFPGRLSARKGPHIFLKAFLNIAQKHPIKAIILGSGPEESSVRKEIQQSAAENIIALPGMVSRDEMPQYFSAADCLVLSLLPVNDSMPITILEAMSNSLPIIASNTAGINTMVRHQSEGFLFTPGSVEQLIQAMLMMMNTPIDERIAMGSSARRRVIEYCTPSRIAHKLIELFTQNSN